MKRSLLTISSLVAVLIVAALVRSHGVVSAQGTCTLQTATAPLVFCDTFDAPAGTGTRTGDLNSTIWGVSRTWGDVNMGQGRLNAVPPTEIVNCSGPQVQSSPSVPTPTVYPPHDVQICNGQLREATNDNAVNTCPGCTGFDGGGVLSLAMYPKQPFDFAGRTGTIGFDVSNDSHGSHSTWPELWMSDKPVPAPFAHFSSWLALPQFGFGLRFAGSTSATGGPSSCPEAGDSTYLGVNSAIVINNYVENDTDNYGNLVLAGFDCVKAATYPGQMNHYEVRVSQNQIDVYGTDAGTTSPLKHLATVQNANLGFTRGLVWLEDVHYNADKANDDNHALSEREHTFVWDNLGFDGPFTYKDQAYDALDNTSLNGDATMNLGQVSSPGQTATWNVLGMPANPTPAAVRVLFSFFPFNIPTSLIVTVNGNPNPTPWPYPDTVGNSWRTFAVTIPVTELVAGTNVVQLGATDQPIVTSNVDIVLVDVGGSPTLPGPASPINLRIIMLGLLGRFPGLR
jgi:hypothetical protein